MGPASAAPLGLGGPAGRFRVLGHHEDHFVVLTHASGCQLTTQEGCEEVHAGSVASTKGRMSPDELPDESPDELKGSTIVVTGVTGQVARPLATALARGNRVIGAARFSDAAARAELEASGVECVPVDLESGDMGQLPEDAEYVLNFAVAKTNDWERDLAANSGGVAFLMEHHRNARAFLHCSSTAVYKPEGHRVFDEDGPLGDNHGVWPFLRTYSICKIAAEGTARWAAERFGLPTTIARLSVPYGDSGGWPAIHLHMMLNGSAIPRARRRAERLPPAPCRRHRGHGAAPAHGGVGTDGDGQLGWERAGQH